MRDNAVGTDQSTAPKTALPFLRTLLSDTPLPTTLLYHSGSAFWEVRRFVDAGMTDVRADGSFSFLSLSRSTVTTDDHAGARSVCFPCTHSQTAEKLMNLYPVNPACRHRRRWPVSTLCWRR